MNDQVCVGERVIDSFPRTPHQKAIWTLLGVLQDLFPNWTSKDRILAAQLITDIDMDVTIRHALEAADPTKGN
jgi:hypothetical protein